MNFDEDLRLEALREYRVSSTPDGGVFDDIALLASRIFSAPIALVTLIGETKQLFKGRVGYPPSEDSREHSFCEFTIRQHDPLVVNDLSLDERFKLNPLVLEGLRFYCGVPVRTPDGRALGTLCVMDRKVRQISAEALKLLGVLARQVEEELELRRRLALLEDALVQQRAEQRSRDLLSAMLVHDLRGPLTSLTLSASLVQPADDDSKEDLLQVVEAAGRMRRMLSDMLDICLYDAGQLKVRRTRFTLDEFTKTVVGRLTRLAAERNQVLGVQAGAEPVVVDADPELLERVLLNLLGNAMAHGPSNQPITVAVLSTGSHARLEVQDQGNAIPLEERAHIFEALTRGGAAATRGHGLGLAFCRLAITAHGGEIGVEPMPGKGNRFFIELPLS